MLNINDYKWNVNLVNDNDINNDIDKIKNFFGKGNSEIILGYYVFVYYINNGIFILPIIFHEPDEDGILNYNNTFFRNGNDDNPITWTSSDYLYLISTNYNGTTQISTSYFTYDIFSKIVIFKDNCFFLPSDYKDYMVNNKDNIK